MRIAEAVRARVKPGFGVGVKLNSADFQRGGFAFEDARQVVEWLNGKGIDFVELGNRSEGYTGADIRDICDSAAELVLERAGQPTVEDCA